ncbi:hypothetical protein Asulf_00375 [Archaeoglobus sulfaticallidus PM70-1]|uniref:rRNA small subunit methyltransferase F RNA-binding PUA-like domain-containing protein n=1 Tax=Archaeoglobus sulfaticallidus PM70-1 TaxID=387631 RepID=N0B9Y7_9EURY|nr:hypothetical protein [Archaeoglobus sulfaticallidus]AGK60404.1 hypothetical protein Asulf_00375 [Archaeoglobus sulfaticallidus PM70-1]
MESEIGRKINEALKERWGVTLNLSFYERGKRRIYAYSCGNLGVRAVSKGLYFATIEKDGLRLSMEGSFIVGKVAKKNVVEVDEEKALRWMRGEAIEINQTDVSEGYVILKYGSYFIGCGKLRNGKIINFVPKDRRL